MLQTFAFSIAVRVWKYLWILAMFKLPHLWAALIVWAAETELEPSREIGDISSKYTSLGKGNTTHNAKWSNSDLYNHIYKFFMEATCEQLAKEKNGHFEHTEKWFLKTPCILYQWFFLEHLLCLASLMLNPSIFVYFCNQFRCVLSNIVDACRIQPLENIFKICLVEEKLLFSDCISFDSSGLKSLSFRF